MSKISGVENEVSTSSSEMKIPSQYDNVDWGARTKLVNRKVSNKSSKDGTVYGSKALMTKEGKLTFIGHLIAESDDPTLLPDMVVSELKGNIRKGAKDLEQKWKNALELVHKAYHVSNVQLPTPTKKGAWKQYEELIRFGVQQLSATRGIKGDWRTSSVLVREAAAAGEQSHIGKRRYFVEIPGERAQEVEGANMDEIIDAISNKIRNSRHVTGTKVRVEERTKDHAVLTVWVNEVKRERITIKQV
jgi:hypothetical protein